MSYHITQDTAQLDKMDVKSMQELFTAKANIDHLLGLTDAQKNKEMER